MCSYVKELMRYRLNTNSLTRWISGSISCYIRFKEHRFILFHSVLVYSLPYVVSLTVFFVHIAWPEYRSWFQLSPSSFLATPELSPHSQSTDMGGNEGGDRWSFFGTRSVVQKSPTDPGSDSNTGESPCIWMTWLLLYCFTLEMRKIAFAFSVMMVIFKIF